MHLFRSHKETPGMFRGHARFELPTNPICWLFGHRARVEVVESKYSDPWLLIECRVCALRYTNPTTERHLSDDPRERRKRAKELKARRVEVARRDPKMVAASASGREGYGHRTLGLNVELVGPKYPGRERRWRDNIGFTLHFGNRGSESPLHLHLHASRLGSAYFSVEGIGGRFCEWIGRGHKRDLSLRTHGGSLWWKVWYDGESGNDEHHRCDKWRRPKLWPWSAGRNKHRSWMCLRDGSIALNPADAFWGSPLYHREPVDGPRTALVVVGDFPHDEYLVDFTLEAFEVRRDHGPAWARRVLKRGFNYDAKANPGIPVRNHDWKGDEILGWGGRIPDGTDLEAGRWLKVAVADTIEHVRRDRKHYGYTPRKVDA
jgi:hypothetical protein